MRTRIFGIIAPHPPIMVEEVGGQRATVTSASRASMRDAASMLAEYDPDTVVIMSPHSPALTDAFAIDTAQRLRGSLEQFGAPAPVFEYRGDPELAVELLGRLEEDSIPVIDRAAVPALTSGTLDHGVLVPMSFLDRDGRWPLLVLSLSYLPYDFHESLGRHIMQAADALGRKIAFVASGDSSHRLTADAPAGFSSRGKEFDLTVVDLISKGQFSDLSHIDPQLVDAAGECGLRSFITLGGMVGDDATTEVLSYEGPWGVGYITAVVNPPTPSSGAKGGAPGLDGHAIVALARRAITEYVTNGRVLAPGPLDDPDLPPRAGTFVSLHREGQLRGCIGTIAPTEDTLADEVIRNAIQAATADPRFPRLSTDELEDLDVKVDVLHVPEGCTFDDLDPADYGVIVGCGARRGLLLPDLEGVDTPEEQLAIACRKAGIMPGEQVELQRFKVDRYA